MNKDMQDGHVHAASTLTYSTDIDMQRGHGTCSIDMDLQYGHVMHQGHGHALRHIHARCTWTCNTDIDIQHVHGHAAWT
jgi:hypothetical protein